MPLILTAVQQVAYEVEYTDKRGNPAPVDGVPSWGVSNPAILTIEPAADGFTALVKATGALGSSQVSVKADVEMGEGITPLVTVDEITVVAAEAVAGTMTAGTPEEQP